MPTTYGDIQQKNRQTIFPRVETSMKMTFHSSGENQRESRRRRAPLSNPPLLFFHDENVSGKNRKDKPRQMSTNLIFRHREGVAPELSTNFCSKYGQVVTQRTQLPVGHRRFLLPMAILGLKKCAPPMRMSHKWRTSICDSLFSQTRPVSRNVHNTCEKNTCEL